MALHTVRRMAATILKAGEARVWFDPLKLEEIGKAITKDDVRNLIRKGYIKAPQKKGVPRTRGRIRAEKKKKGRQRGRGKMRGTYSARMDEKKRWMQRLRAQRRLLQELRAKEKLESGFKTIYLRIKGGSFADKGQLMTYLKEKGYLKQ